MSCDATGMARSQAVDSAPETDADSDPDLSVLGSPCVLARVVEQVTAVEFETDQAPPANGDIPADRWIRNAAVAST